MTVTLKFKGPRNTKLDSLTLLGLSLFFVIISSPSSSWRVLAADVETTPEADSLSLTSAELPPSNVPSYDELYRLAVDAYLENRWYECISYMLSALDFHRTYKKNLVSCRAKCHLEADTSDLLTNTSSLQFFERFVRNTLCLMKCKKTRVTQDYQSIKKIDDEFEQKTPYDYLQLCYYKANDLDRASSCAYTFLLYNPSHEVMTDNLKYYSSFPGIDVSLVENLEAQEYQKIFLQGNEAYNKEMYSDVTKYIEKALVEYYKAEDECRYLCEGEFSHGPTLDLTMTVANHFTYSLRCKLKCHNKLSFIFGQQYADFLPSLYHYLQFAYYQIGSLKKACEAVATFLLFHPDDETMQHNKDYYMSSAEDAKTYFVPRKEAVKYIKREKEEKELLKFIEESFHGLNSGSNVEVKW